MPRRLNAHGGVVCSLLSISGCLAAADGSATAPEATPPPAPAPVLAPAHDSLDLGDLQIHGFASQGYLKSSANNALADSKRGSAEFNEFALTIIDRPTPDLSIGVQFGARDVGTLGDDEPNLDWAMADYHWRDWLGLRVGKIKQPQGLYNEYRDVDLTRTAVLLPQGVYQENLRDVNESFIGAEAYGDCPLEDLGSGDYQVYAGNIVSRTDGLTQLVDDTTPITVSSVHFRYAWGGRATWIAPLPGLRAIGYYNRANLVVDGTLTLPPFGPGQPPVTIPVEAENDVQICGTGAEYERDDLTLAAEYQHVIVRSTPLGAASAHSAVGSNNGYVLASYRFNPWFALGSYAAMTREKGMSGAHSYQKDLALTVRFDPDPHWLVKLEGHYMDGTALLINSQNPDGYDDHWWLFAAKTTFSF